MNQAPVCFLFGRRGAGKSTLARKIARHQARLIVWDYMGEHGPLAFRSDGNLGALTEYLHWARGEKFAAARYIPSSGDVEEFEEFCRIVYSCRDFVVMVEEVAAVCQASYISPEFGKIVRTGRHRGLGLLCCTQRLNEVSRTLTALTDYWIGFNIAEPADKFALAQRCGPDYTEEVAGLPRFEWQGFEVDTREAFTDEARLMALWGAPVTWKLPVEQNKAASATANAKR